MGAREKIIGAAGAPPTGGCAGCPACTPSITPSCPWNLIWIEMEALEPRHDTNSRIATRLFITPQGAQDRSLMMETGTDPEKLGSSVFQARIQLSREPKPRRHDVMADICSGHLWQSNDRHLCPRTTRSVESRWLMIYSNVPQDCSSKRQAISRRCLSASSYILVSSPGRHFSAAVLLPMSSPVPFLPFADPYHSKHRGVPDTPFACPSFWSSSTRTSRLVIRGVISCHVLILPCPEGALSSRGVR